MARNGVVFVLLLSFNVMYGLIIHTEPDNLQVAVTENVVHVTGSILSSNLDKLRGHVLKKLRAGLEVSPDFLTNSNLSATIKIWCPISGSRVFWVSPQILVKQLDNATKLYLEFALPEEYSFECINSDFWNLTVSFLNGDRKLNTQRYKQSLRFDKLEAYYQEADCDYNTSSCFPWKTDGTTESFNSCTSSYCENIPKLENRLTYMAAPEDIRTYWSSRDIYGSGSSCSLNLYMTAHSATYLRVSINSSKGTSSLLREKFEEENMDWTVVKIPIGKVDEVFRLNVCIYTIYIAAIERIWLENCTAMEADTSCAGDDFRCSSGKCIPRDRVCDLNPDCPLLDDEDKEFCKSQMYEEFCDLERGTCNWTPTPECSFVKQDLFIYDPVLMKHKKYCNYDEQDFVFVAQNCKNGVLSSLKSPLMPPFNSSKDCRLRLWYVADMFDVIKVKVCSNESSCIIIKSLTSWGSQPEWNRVSIPLPHHYQPYYVVLQGNQAYGKVLLDQISFTADCFTKSDTWQEPRLEEVSMINNTEDSSDYILTVIGVGAGVVLALITAVVIFSVFKKRRDIKSNESCQNILPSSTASSGLDGKCSFPVDISDSSSADCERQSLVPSNLAVSSISPYYEWTEDKIRDIPRKKITLVKLLGTGAFGEVYYGMLADVSRRKNLPIAVKKLITLCPEQTKAELFFEAITLSKFSHPNIVRFLGISTDEMDQSMYLLLELMEGGDLRTFIRESRPKQPNEPSYLTLHDLLKLGMDVARGCQYLEQNKFIHRDIAARNCLLTEKGPNRVAKIGDFGMARDVLRTNYYRKNGRAMVPVKWMPPESFLDGIFTSKTDIWAFGVVLWELFTMGHVPYPGKSNDNVMKYVKGGGRLEQTPLSPHPVYDLMMQCWHVNPDFRPNFASVVDELERIYNEEELSSLITYEDIMGIPSNTCDKDHMTSGSVTYATDIKESSSSLKLMSDADGD